MGTFCAPHAAGLEHSNRVPQMHMPILSKIPTSFFRHTSHSHVLPSQDVLRLTFGFTSQTVKY